MKKSNEKGEVVTSQKLFFPECNNLPNLNNPHPDLTPRVFLLCLHYLIQEMRPAAFGGVEGACPLSKPDFGFLC